MKSIKKNVLKSFLFVCLGLTVTTIAFASVRSLYPPSAPGMPVFVDVWKHGCTFKYLPPEDDGGSPVIYYFVQSRDEFSFRWIDRGLALECEYTISNMQEGSTAEFRVSAVNECGQSEPSLPSDYVTFED